MKPSLQLKLSQHLTLTPQLQQSIKLLQLSTIELNQEIERILLENPMLEREDGDGADFAPQAPAAPPPEREQAQESAAEAPAPDSDQREGGEGSSADDSIDWSNVGTGASSRSESDDDDVDYQDLQAAGVSLREHLDQQVALSQLSDRDRALVRFLIEALDDDGYLHQPLDDLLQLLPPEADVDLDDLAIALHHVQNLEPVGIGARSPQECLALQLRTLPASPTRARSGSACVASAPRSVR